MTDQREQPHIVKQFMIGNTKISIADNYCLDQVKDKDKIDEILRRCADIALNAWAGEIARKRKEKEKEQQKK